MNRIKHHDKKNALSIVNAAEREMRFTLKQIVSEESAFNVIRNIYESFRMLGDALLLSKGIVSQDHVEQVRELEKIQVKTQRPIRVVDSLRRLRHNINYYGYKANIEETKDTLSLAKSCFNPLFNEIIKIIEQ